MQNKVCVICVKEFKPYSDKSKFCSSACMGISYRSNGLVKTGAKIGFLTMIEPCGKKDTVCKKWLCRCDCGNTVQKSRTQLVNRPDLADCGCKTEWPNIRRSYGTNKDTNGVLDRHTSVFVRKAKERGLEVSLTKSQIETLFLGDCYYCGAVPSQTKDARSLMSATRNGIDRINNSIGYVDGNCVSCCYPCNWSKRDGTMEDFIERCKKIVSRHASIGAADGV